MISWASQRADGSHCVKTNQQRGLQILKYKNMLYCFTQHHRMSRDKSSPNINAYIKQCVEWQRRKLSNTRKTMSKLHVRASSWVRERSECNYTNKLFYEEIYWDANLQHISITFSSTSWFKFLLFFMLWETHFLHCQVWPKIDDLQILKCGAK